MCLGSCIGSCCATCGCECLKACCPATKNMSRLPYIALMFFATLLALILRYYGGPILVDLYIYNWELCTSDKCVGFGAVYRISFALFVFFLVLGLLLLAQSCYSVDRGHWGLKLFSFLALLVISWLIPNDFYEVYVHISRVVSGVFLFLQILILLDFAISLNEELVERKDAKAVVLALSLAFYAASLVLMVFMFLWFAGDGCHVEKFILAFTICTTFVFTLLSLSSAAANRGGLLPAAVMSLYIHYVAYSALSSNPSSCNTLHDTSTVQLVIGLIIASLSISYAAWNLATSNSLFGDPKDEDDVRAEKEQQMSKAVASGDLGTATMNSAAAADVKSADAVVVPVKAEAEAPAEPKRSRVKPADAAAAGGDDDVDPAELARQDAANATRNARFHFVMAAAGMYMAMILTNWSNYKVGVDELDGQTSDFGLESMWIKVVSQWVTVLLYIWWLLAPIICSNRDFSNDS